MRTPSSTAAAPEQWSGLDDLVARTAAGDEQALGALYDRTSALVYGLSLHLLGDRAAARDVTVDVYLQVWRGAARWDAARGRPVAWLLALTRSRALERRRASSPHAARSTLVRLRAMLGQEPA